MVFRPGYRPCASIERCDARRGCEIGNVVGELRDIVTRENDRARRGDRDVARTRIAQQVEKDALRRGRDG